MLMMLVMEKAALLQTKAKRGWKESSASERKGRTEKKKKERAPPTSFVPPTKEANGDARSRSPPTLKTTATAKTILGCAVRARA